MEAKEQKQKRKHKSGYGRRHKDKAIERMCVCSKLKLDFLGKKDMIQCDAEKKKKTVVDSNLIHLLCDDSRVCTSESLAMMGFVVEGASMSFTMPMSGAEATFTSTNERSQT